MAASQFRVANGLKANGNVTFLSTANEASDSKILGLDSAGKVIYRTNSDLAADLSVITAVSAGAGMDFTTVSSGSAEVVMGDPGATVHDSTSETTATSHTHAITASATPGAAASLLKTTGAGLLTLVDLVLSGNLTVSGTTTTVSSTNLLVADKLITLNDGGGATSGTGVGIEIEENNAVTGFLKTDGTGDWTIRGAGTAAVNVLTVDINATKKITVTGDLSIEGDSIIDQDLSADSTAAALATLTIATSLVPDASAGATLGTAALPWGDVFVADDKKIQFGAAQDVTIEYDEDGTDSLLISGGDVTLADDKKLYFGTGQDASLRYDEATNDVLTLDGGNLLVTGTNQIQFNDATQYIAGTSATAMTLVATDEVDITATTIDVNGLIELSGNFDHNSIVTTKVSSQAAIATTASAYLFEEILTGFTAAEVLVQFKAADGTKQTQKIIMDYDGSAVTGTAYAILGHEIVTTIVAELTNGSGASGTTHMGLKVTNTDGQNITANSIRQLIAA